LVELADSDPSVVLLTGDLGYTVLEPFAERFEDRFFNVGVAEQNMLGVAAGLAACGFTPFAYSIATFASMRPYEFFRNGAILHELPVRLVGVGGGLDYGHNGVTHYALEDVALMRAQPGLTVIAPADPLQAHSAVLATAAMPGPVYLRLGKNTTALPGLDGRFRMGRAEFIGAGTDVAIITYGGIAAEALAAASMLSDQGLNATVAIVAALAPAPTADLIDLLSTVPLAVTVEAHYKVGGVASLVSDVIADNGLDSRLIRCGIADMPRGFSGDVGFLHEHHGLTAAQVAETVVSALERA
jgi:transketolase